MTMKLPSSIREARALRRHAERGVTLIELMVGLVIALLSSIVIAQVMAFAEGQKRSAISGSDAQVNGALALYSLQRDVEMSGYGLSATSVGLGCTIKSPNYTSSNGGDRTLAPVLITNGASGASDSIRIIGSGKASFSVPIRVTGIHPKTGAGSTAFAVANNMGVQTGDLMIAVPPVPSSTDTCTVFKVNAASSAGFIPHAVGDPGSWNQADNAVYPAAGYPNDSYLINIGPGLVDKTYSISAGGSLQLREFDGLPTAANLTPLEMFPQIVNLQAFYGKDSNGDGTIDVYDTVQPTTGLEWSRVMALRIALVARSGQFENEDVTPSAPVWDLGSTPTVTGSTACGTSQCLTLNVNADVTTDWRRYRYKVYDTVIPLRNLLWRS